MFYTSFKKIFKMTNLMLNMKFKKCMTIHLKNLFLKCTVNLFLIWLLLMFALLQMKISAINSWSKKFHYFSKFTTILKFNNILSRHWFQSFKRNSRFRKKKNGMSICKLGWLNTRIQGRLWKEHILLPLLTNHWSKCWYLH